MKNNIVRAIAEAGEISYLVPKGHHRAVHSGVTKWNREDNGKITQMVRFHFDLDVPGHEGMQFKAARNFHLRLVEGSGLHTFLRAWIGADVEKLEPSLESLQQLVGREGVATIEHWPGSMPTPFVNVKWMRPAGAATGPEEEVVVMEMPRFNVSTPSTVTGNANVKPAVVVPAPASSTANGFCPCCGSPRKAS